MIPCTMVKVWEHVLKAWQAASRSGNGAVKTMLVYKIPRLSKTHINEDRKNRYQDKIDIVQSTAKKRGHV